MENERWQKCKKCDAMVTPMFSKKLCFDHLTEELASKLPEGFKAQHVAMVLNVITNHYYPLKHKPKLDEHVKKEWNGDDKENIKVSNKKYDNETGGE
jgi:hypothetical protein